MNPGFPLKRIFNNGTLDVGTKSKAILVKSFLSTLNSSSSAPTQEEIQTSKNHFMAIKDFFSQGELWYLRRPENIKTVVYEEDGKTVTISI